MKSVKVVTVGAATFDTFLCGEELRSKRDVRTNDYVEQFPLGAKVEVDGLEFSTGGGASNAAVTFARQGFETSVVAKIGDDVSGHEILDALKREGIKTERIKVDLKARSGYSTILLAPTGERTILVYRGVSEQLAEADVKLPKAQWLYISSLAGNLKLLRHLLAQAKKQHMKVAYNPGGRELEEAAELRKLVNGIDVLITNKDELAAIYYKEDSDDLIKAAASLARLVVMTNAAHGSWTTDGSKIYRAGMYQDVRVVDRTGAGDAFGSGLVAKFAMGGSIEEAISFGSANSTAVVGQIGGKAGILRRTAKVKTMPIKVSSLA